MYWTKIRLTGLTAINLPKVGVTHNDTFILQSITGLGPPDINVALGNNINQGAQFLGRNTTTRQLVILVGLNPTYASGQTAADLRAILYGLLSPNPAGSVAIDLMNGSTVVCSTVGYVSKMEPNMFSADPQVQITIECSKLYLEGPVVAVTLGTLDKISPVINNIGSAPTGFFMSVQNTGAQAYWQIADSLGNIFQNPDWGSTNDILSMNTEFGSRMAQRQSGLTVLDDIGLINTLIPTVPVAWHQLQPGNNTFTIMPQPTGGQRFNWVDVHYTPKYWGV